jgi:hypothetical protein
VTVRVRRPDRTEVEVVVVALVVIAALVAFAGLAWWFLPLVLVVSVVSQVVKATWRSRRARRR